MCTAPVTFLFPMAVPIQFDIKLMRAKEMVTDLLSRLISDIRNAPRTNDDAKY